MSDLPPGYWQNETSGLLRPVVIAYLEGEPLDGAQVATMRAYLRQWIMNPALRGPYIDVLRTSVDTIATRKDIDRWLDRATHEGVDPL